MSYVDRVLQPSERVLATGRMHWIVYFRGFALLAVGVALLLIHGPDGGLSLIKNGFGYLLILYGLCSLVSTWIEVMTTEVAVTNRRVIQKRGLISRHTGEMNMERVESVIVEQSILGRLLDYGTVVIRGTGAGIEGLHHIAAPLELRSAIVVR